MVKKRQDKIKVAVSYQTKNKKIDIEFDKKLQKLFESIGCKWYAQGMEVETGKRDYAFDLDMKKVK